MTAFTAPATEATTTTGDLACDVLIRIDRAISAQEEARDALLAEDIEQRFIATQTANAMMDDIEGLLMSFATPSLYMAFENTSLTMVANNIRVNVQQCKSSADEALAAIKSLRTTWTTLFPDAQIGAFAAENSAFNVDYSHARA